MRIFNAIRPSWVSRAGAAVLITAALVGAWMSASSAVAATFTGRLSSRFTAGRYAPRGARLPFSGPQQSVCGTPSRGQGECLIHVLKPSTSKPAQTDVTSPTGLPPSTIESVYGFSTSSTAGAGETIALVDAYNDPDAASDLNTFSKQYGLPTECTGGATPSSGCFDFSQVNQSGGSSLPSTNSGWDLEISLDIEWAHALAPAANILLVEASSSSLSNLLAAETYAGDHANVASNSWGSSEFSGESSYDSYFTHPGVTYFAASGDTGAEVLWPSASPDVISAGGTSLTFTSGGTLAQESAWSDGGGGCSGYETANSAQSTGSVNCSGKRATPDISLDADPNSGMSVLDSVTYENQYGWWTVGGTSASTAMLAGESAAVGVPMTAQYVYGLTDIRDILSGSNGHSALTGYDLATGLGSFSYTPGGSTGLTATEGSGGVQLAWNAPTGPGVTQYNIWRGTSSGQESTEIGSVSGSGPLTFTDSTASSGGTYYYEVQAVNAAGVGPFSSEAVSAPPSTPPVASFTTSCSGATCKFTSTSTDAQGTIARYAWNGGNNNTGTASTFSDTYSGAGTYTASLVVTNTAGQSSAAATTQVKCTSSGSRRRSTLTCT